MNESHINLVILEDHRSIVDGYLYRLQENPNIRVAGIISSGEELEPTLEQTPAQVLLLDIQVPISSVDSNPYPIMQLIPQLVSKYPDLNILVITMHTQPILVESLVEMGVKGIIFKDDSESITKLAKVVASIAGGGTYFSQAAQQIKSDADGSMTRPVLSARQRQVLELCAAYPESTSADLAKQMGIADSTLRTLLSKVYLRLGVRNRAAAVLKAKKIGLIVSLKD